VDVTRIRLTLPVWVDTEDDPDSMGFWVDADDEVDVYDGPDDDGTIWFLVCGEIGCTSGWEPVHDG
jgi:hypothetical protein